MGKVSKMEAVRQAIRELGKDAMPVSIQISSNENSVWLDAQILMSPTTSRHILRKQSAKESVMYR